MRSGSAITRALCAGAAVVAALSLSACSGSSAGPSDSGAATTSSVPTSSGPTPSAPTASGPSPSSATPSVPIPSNTSAGKGTPPVILGDKNSPQAHLLGELYSQALRAKGYRVTLKNDLGSSELIDTALTSGRIDLYPESAGVIYTDLARLGDRPTSAASTYGGAQEYERNRGFALLRPTPFQDVDGLAVRTAYARRYGLTDIADLSRAGSFTLAGPPASRSRYAGVMGLRVAYLLSRFRFVPLAIGRQYRALDRGKVDAITVPTTDARLAGNRYTMLTDSLGIFGYQQVAPVVRRSVLRREGRPFAQILNAVSVRLTTTALVTMDHAVQIDGTDPGTVAARFLAANGLN